MDNVVKNLRRHIFRCSHGKLRNIFELETKLFPCLVDMKFKGVKIDVQKARKIGLFLEKDVIT